ncbi:hypothetical protein [Devosia sp.]|uniref:hypothetical protein n=1 Tax=Devosia sp. TaxID=1871048 RepID=UPI003BA8B9BB
MDEVGTDGRLRHVVPMHNALRVFLIVCGLIVLVLTLGELGRGLWPPSFVSLFFLIIVVGAFSVGVPMIAAGLLAPAATWTVAKGRIDIELRTPFSARTVSITPGAVADFELREIEWDSSGPTWGVVLKTVDGKRYHTRDFGSKATAEAFRDRIRLVLEG